MSQEPPNPIIKLNKALSGAEEREQRHEAEARERALAHRAAVRGKARAFPAELPEGRTAGQMQQGMTLLEHLTAQALHQPMPALAMREWRGEINSPEAYARASAYFAVLVAEATLLELERRKHG